MNIYIATFTKKNNSIYFNKSHDYNFMYILKKNLEKGMDNTVFFGDYDFININAVILFRLEIGLLLELKKYDLLHRTVFIPFEPPVVDKLYSDINLKWISQLFAKTLTWQDDLCETPSFGKFYFPVTPKETDWLAYHEKKLLTMIVRNKQYSHENELYSERKRAIKYFESVTADFHLYGDGWEGNSFQSYRGKTGDKIGTLKKYRFAICFENQKNINGLLSEKIFDCFYAGCIPVFLGASNVLDYIPKNAFIDFRNYSSYADLLSYLTKISEIEYNEKLCSIKTFLKSDEFKKYHPEYFSKTVIEELDFRYDNEVRSNGGKIDFLLLKLVCYKIYYKVRRVLYKLIMF